MADRNEPIQPTPDFAKRYRLTSRYGFYMRVEGGDTEDANQTLLDIGPERFVVLDVNPQQISMREPVATAISFTQGGGKIRESRGNLVKMISISGTTGYTPLPQGSSLRLSMPHPLTGIGVSRNRGGLVPTDVDALDTRLGQRSGFYAFHNLRYLFRQYAYELKKGRTDVTLNYIDTKNDEYWRVEPQEFVMTRSARKPFSYDYQISLTAIEPSSGSNREAAAKLGSLFQFGADTLINPGIKQSLKRMNEMSRSALDFLKHLSGLSERLLQTGLRHVNKVVGYFENAHDAFTTVLATPLVLLAQLDSTLAGISSVSLSLNRDIIAIRSGVDAVRFGDTSLLSGELNEWYLEMQHLSDFLKANVKATQSHATNFDIVRENQKFSTGQAKQGTATAVMQPASGSAGSPDVSPFLNSSGLNLVTDVNRLAKNQAVKTVVVNIGDTIFSLAQRLLGDTQRFIDLVLLNNLAAPYIVSNTGSKPDGTIAWGEFIQVPTTATDSLVTPSGPPALAPSLHSMVTDTGTLYELIDTSFTLNGLAGWLPNQWIGYTITLTHLGIDYTRVVVGNDKDHLQINIPWTVAISVGDAYTVELIQFSAHRPVTPEVKAFGSDVLLKFTPAVGASASSTLADIVVNSSRDVAVVRGLSNLFQAVNIRLHIEQGRLPLHPEFGVQIPIGRPWGEDLGMLYKFLVRGSILSDPRITKVTNMQITLRRDQFSFSADVQPIKVKNSQPVSVTLP